MQLCFGAALWGGDLCVLRDVHDTVEAACDSVSSIVIAF